MNKERYKYTPDIEQLSDFNNFTRVEKNIDAQKTLYTETENGYAIEVERNGLCSGITTADFRYAPSRNYKVENTIKMDDNSHLRLVIYHHSSSDVKIKESLSAIIGAGSRLEIVVIADTHSLILSDYSFTSHRDSSVSITTLDINNSKVIRNQYFDLGASGAECTVNGLYITGGEEHVDNYVKVNHSTPQCTSNQLFKGVLSGKSTAAFTGHILVGLDAQKTAAYQQNHNILLSDTARINTRPQLEIYADDVKCNHGATVGRLDPEAIYYMRQRGIPTDAARRLQLTGFAEDVVKLEPFGELQTIVQQKIAQKLASI